MFFFLSKALLFLLSPFFWVVVSLFFYFYLKQSKWKMRMKWISLGLFLFFSNTMIFLEACRMWEFPADKISTVQSHDVAIVLGGMAEYNSDIEELSIRRQGDRILHAVTLYKTGKIRKILISGDSGFITERGLHEAKQLKELLVKWGLPSEDILTEERSKNTHENAYYTTKLLKESYPELRSFLLITSGIHMKRAKACFEKEGLKCTPHSTDLFSSQKRGYQWDQYIIPSVDNFVQWNKLIKEIVGYMSYGMVGYI